MHKLNLLMVAVILSDGVEAMSRQQFQNSAKIMKKSCMPKHRVTEDEVGDIENGKFIENRNVMCYIACIYQLLQIVKNNKLSYEASLKQIDMLYPPEIKDAAKAALDNCQDVSKKYEDVCEASYWTTKCMYDTDPKNFIFA